MCSCKSKNKTPFCNNICDCVDWSNHDEWVGHIHVNLLNGDGGVLTYESLETLGSKPAILCALHRCKKCGKQICFGQMLDKISSFDDFMSALLLERPSGDKGGRLETEITVICLLHEEDRELALDWLYDTHIGLKIGITNPDFNENVKHVPGYSFELKKNLYMGLRHKAPDLTMISDLSRSDIHWLKEQHESRVRREKEIAQRIAEYSHIWDACALETRVFGDAIDVAEAERPKHTGNQWVESIDGRVKTHEISNAVYKMRIRIEAPRPSDIVQIGSVRWELTLNVLPKFAKHYGRIIAEGKKNKIYLEEDAEKYVTGRKKAYAKYFTEEYPPVPEELAHYFKVNGVLLPEYTIERSN